MTQSVNKAQGQPKTAAKNRLLEAGTRLITTRAPLTSRALAAEAQVNHAMINYYFGGLGELLDLLVDRCIEELRVMLIPELEKMESAAGLKDKTGAKEALQRLLAILSGPQGAKLLNALTQPQPGAGNGVYPRVMKAVLKPMHKSFNSLLANFRGIEAGSLQCSVLGQLMIAECMAFFRGGGVVLEELGQNSFSAEQILKINEITFCSLCSKAGLA